MCSGHDISGHVETVANATVATCPEGSPAHFHCEIGQYLNTVLPGRWIGRASGNDQQLMLWLPRSPDIKPCAFFFWFGYFSKTGYSPKIAT
jgi:hypothetical protein